MEVGKTLTDFEKVGGTAFCLKTKIHNRMKKGELNSISQTIRVKYLEEQHILFHCSRPRGYVNLTKKIEYRLLPVKIVKKKENKQPRDRAKKRSSVRNSYNARGGICT